MEARTDITYCFNRKCKHEDCERHETNIRGIYNVMFLFSNWKPNERGCEGYIGEKYKQ